MIYIWQHVCIGTWKDNSEGSKNCSLDKVREVSAPENLIRFPFSQVPADRILKFHNELGVLEDQHML